MRLLEFEVNELGNYQYVVVELSDAHAEEDRDLVLEALHAENVMARRTSIQAYTVWSRTVHCTRSHGAICG